MITQSVTFGASGARALLGHEHGTSDRMGSAAPTLPPPTLAEPPRAIVKRPVLRNAAALALLLLALVLGAIYWNEQNKANRSRDFTAALAQAQSALSRGDLGTAERALVALAGAQPDHPGVGELKTELDQRRREQLAKREQLRDAILKATRALGFADPALSSAEAPPAPETPAVGVAAPETGATDPRESKCNDTLAALSLCPHPESGKP